MPALSDVDAIAVMRRRVPTIIRTLTTPPVTVDGRPVEVDGDGIVTLDHEQVLAVRRETAALTEALANRQTAPIDVSALTRAVCEALRDVDVMSALPDAYGARTHTVRRGRNKKGNTARVTHYAPNPAPITSDDHTMAGWTIPTSDGAERRMSSVDLARFADFLLRATADNFDGDSLALIGMEGKTEAWSQTTPALSPCRPSRIVHARKGKRGGIRRTVKLAWNGAPMSTDDTYGVHGDACGTARQASDMAGWYDVPSDWLTGNSEARPHGAHDTAPWQARRRLVLRRRKSETDIVTAPLVVDVDGTARGSLTECLAPADDARYMFVGHRKVARQEVKSRGTTRQERQAVTEARRAEVASVPTALVDAIAVALASDGPTTLPTPNGTLTIGAVDASGRVRLALARQGGNVTRWQARASAGRIAVRVMS
jgi:hypothetical protein